MGLITTLLRRSVIHSYVAVSEPGNVQDDETKFIEDYVSRILHVLPQGTKFIRCVKMTIADLSIPYQLTFEHPWFQDGMTFEERYVRELWKNEDPMPGGSFVNQFNLFLGITYKYADGVTWEERNTKPIGS